MKYLFTLIYYLSHSNETVFFHIFSFSFRSRNISTGMNDFHRSVFNGLMENGSMREDSFHGMDVAVGWSIIGPRGHVRCNNCLGDELINATRRDARWIDGKIGRGTMAYTRAASCSNFQPLRSLDTVIT